MKSPIGMGRLGEGVYYVDKFALTMAQVNVVGSQNLWHGRLGHPSNQVLTLLSKEFNIDSDGNKKPCDICFHAK